MYITEYCISTKKMNWVYMYELGEMFMIESSVKKVSCRIECAVCFYLCKKKCMYGVYWLSPPTRISSWWGNGLLPVLVITISSVPRTVSGT